MCLSVPSHLREGRKLAKIPHMTNEHDLNPTNAFTPEPDQPDDHAEPDAAASSSIEAATPEPLEQDTARNQAAERVDPPEEAESPLDELDIDAALAAVSSLSDVIAEQEAAEEARLARITAAEHAAAERQARIERPEMFFDMPTSITLRRGHPSSVIPGALLIGIGAWLTFILTTSAAPPSNALLIGVALGGIGVALLAHWIASGRWARGAFFLGTLLLAIAGGSVFFAGADTPDLSTGWYLLVIAPGTALLLAAFLARPLERKLVLPGLTLILGGTTTFAISSGILGGQVAAIVRTLWPLALAIVLALLVLPIFVRRRNASRH